MDDPTSLSPAFVNVAGKLYNLHFVKRVEFEDGRIMVTIDDGGEETTFYGPDNGAYHAICQRYSVNGLGG